MATAKRYQLVVVQGLNQAHFFSTVSTPFRIDKCSEVD